MTPEDRAAMLAKHPNCWWCKVIIHGNEFFLAIPKRDPAPDVPGMPGMTLDMLHGATMRIGDRS